MKYAAAAAALALSVAPVVNGQVPLAFEVASVKRAAPGSDVMSMRNQPGQWGTGNLPLRTVITQAFGVQGYQVVGGPDWIGSDRWDISARMPAGTSTQEQRREMIRTLLADRFKLKTHTETRELPIYALVLARTDGRPGADLRAPAVDCPALRAQRAAAAKTGGAAGFVAISAGQLPECGISLSPAPGGGMAFKGQGQTIESFSRTVQTFVDRPVFDRTGLKGEYDIELSFMPARGGPVIGDGDVPSIFTALPERLGLKLEATKGPIEVLVIDAVEQPTEN